MHIGGYATPFLYIYLLLVFESGVSRNVLMCWAFALGLTIDVFSDTPGMNAASAVLLAFLRPNFLRLFTPRDALESFVPSFHTLGVFSFLKYALLCTLVHHLLLVSLEFFSFVHLGILSLRIVLSVLLTTLCIMAVEAIRKG